MVLAMPHKITYEYRHANEVIVAHPRVPNCSFCWRESVFTGSVKTGLIKEIKMYACMVCKETLKEIVIKSRVSHWKDHGDEIWYKYPREIAEKHPLVVKWIGC